MLLDQAFTERSMQSGRVGVHKWTRNSGIAVGIVEGIRELGYHPVQFKDEEPLPPGLDMVIAYGPYGSLAPLASQLLACRSSQRPSLAFIQVEQMPSPAQPEWLRSSVGMLRSWIERAAYTQAVPARWRTAPRWKSVQQRGLRFRYYGDLFWLRREGLLTVLAVWSRWTADWLRQRGFEPLVLTGGRDPSMGRDLGLERDIPVLWIGKTGSDRRARLLKRLRQELAERGVELLVVDGVDHPAVFEEDRTRLLNRSKIMVNLLRQRWDDNSLRYALAAHNGALVIGEPTLPHSAFQPGEHLVEAPVERMADTILYYLEHEDERRAIVENAARLIESHTRPGRGMAPLIEKALSVHPISVQVEAAV